MAHTEFNFIYVIESLPAGNKPTGRHLHEGTIAQLVAAMRQDGFVIDCALVGIETLPDLLGFLDRVRREVVEHDRFPILHFEVHGEKGGLSLRSGEFVPWEALAEPLTAINIAMRNNLLVTLAVCSGAYLATLLSAARRAPFWGIMGPDRPEWDGELLAGYKAFFETLLTTFDGDQAVESLRAATQAGGNAHYLFFTAERMFKSAFRAYIDRALNDIAIEERIARLIATATAQRTLPAAEKEAIAAQMRNKMRDPSAAFERFRRIHFMIDLFPENDARFPITLADIMK